MFKSYSLAALAAVASAQYGHHGLSYSDHIPHKPHGDGFDDGYAKDVFHNHLHSGRRHQTLDLDDEKHAPVYGPRKDLRREDADIDTNKESPDYRHENGDHQNQEYGEKDVRNDDDLDARGLSGLTGGSREKGYSRQSYGYQQPSYQAPSYKVTEDRYEQQPSYGYQQPSYGRRY